MDHTTWINQLFSSYVIDNDIEIVFEEKEKLKFNQKVLNLSIHPIRFADDIFFNFQTNNEILKAKLKKYEVDYNLFYYHADIVKATYLKSVKGNNIKKNSLLLIGQTEKDKVVFNDGKYLSLLDFLPEIKKIASCYDAIYFKPHPYAKNNKTIHKALKRELGNTILIYDNIYHLLSNENILHCVALNSSVLYEAKYFKKETTFLYKPTFDFEKDDIGIYGDYWSSAFWSDILDIEDAGITLPFIQNRLRKTLNNFWGYNKIDDEIILKKIIKENIKSWLLKYTSWI